MMVKACVEIWPAVMGLLDDRENTQQIHNEIQKKLKEWAVYFVNQEQKRGYKMSRLNFLN